MKIKAVTEARHRINRKKDFMLNMRNFQSQLRSTKVLSIATMLLIFIALLALNAFLLHSQSVSSQPSSSPYNPIVQENQRPGTSSWLMTKQTPYDSKTFRFPAIEGYAWTTSAIAGDTMSFSVSTTQSHFIANIYRLGWYQGLGGRLMQTIPNIPGHFYPTPAMDPQTGLVEPDWPASFTIKIGPGWVTGMYVAKLIAADGTEAYVPFVVRSVQPTTFVFLHDDTTEQAYNAWGGKSLYDFNSTDGHRAYKVSFNRPLEDQAGFGSFLYWEYPMIRWLEKNGYDLGYLSNVDIQSNADLLRNHRGILIVGHSEYWSKEMRDHLEAAVNSGVNLANFAADSLAVQIRFEPSSSNIHPLPNRIIVCYKDASLDPLTGKDNARVTVGFRDPPVNRPEQTFLGAMSGAYFTIATGFPWVVANASSWVFGGSGLKNGDSLPTLVGYECDIASSSYPIPAGLTILAASPVYTSDNNSRVCNTTLYTARSGARVFNAGTFRWSWGLDSFNYADGHKNVASLSIQLLTQNILQNFQTGFD